ncbi:hypothetical protein V6N11_054639 [Hibiscus sabdariffa]|uniref:Uncharacterized protein n=1 Tax=Hibiscus sabdariffa TaxID=183260 RepID=A0ABR2S4I8_9ROSI
MAANSWQFGAMSEPSRWVHEVSIVSLENKINQLTNIIYSLVVRRNRPDRVCGICTMPDHPTDYCPTLQEETSELVYGIGNFSGPPQGPHNPHSSTYNPGWRDHPNLSYAQNPRLNPTFQPYQQPQKSSLESMMENFIASQENFQNQT